MGRGGGSPGKGEGGRGVGQSLLGGRRPGRQGQHLLMPRRATQGDTHSRGGRLQEIIFFSAFLYFTNSPLPQRLFCNQKKKSLAEKEGLLIRQGDHTTVEGPLTPLTGLGDPLGCPSPCRPSCEMWPLVVTCRATVRTPERFALPLTPPPKPNDSLAGGMRGACVVCFMGSGVRRPMGRGRRD